MSVYVTDTHPLIWYAAKKHRQLSHKVLNVFHAAFHERALIHVPVFVLWEIGMLLKVGRILLQESYADWVERLVGHPGFALAPADVRVLIEAHKYPFPDPFDAGIAATARIMDLPLITRDREINDSHYVEVFW